MMIQQILPPQKPLFHIINTSKIFSGGLNRSFQDIPQREKGAVLEKTGA